MCLCDAPDDRCDEGQADGQDFLGQKRGQSRPDDDRRAWFDGEILTAQEVEADDFDVLNAEFGAKAPEGGGVGVGLAEGQGSDLDAGRASADAAADSQALNYDGLARFDAQDVEQAVGDAGDGVANVDGVRVADPGDGLPEAENPRF